MLSRSKVLPVEYEEKDNGENGFTQRAHTISTGLANGLLPQLSAIDFHQITGRNSFVSQDHSVLTVVLERESERQSPPPPSPGSVMKRRNSNAVNHEKMLQKVHATSSDTRSHKRKVSAGSYAAILELAEGVSGENEVQNSNRVRRESGEGEGEKKESENESSGVSKPEDPDHALLQYFARMSSCVDADDSLDLEHIQSLLRNGASVNTRDRFGQTVLHEASKTWGVDVAQFFVERGADINNADDYGRTPLHVAASVDFPEMVRFLIENGADFHVTTKGELQTPLHFAARNEASQCVKILLAYGASVEARDYKERTPLQLAAETNSAVCAGILIEAGASAGTRDDSGLSALTLMVTKMPSVALRALDQFHITDKSHRKQRYYLNFLDYCDPPDTQNRSVATSPLQTIVEMNCFELIMHPIFQRLMEVKWRFFGLRAWMGIFLNILLTVAYTVLGITHPTNGSNYYVPFSKNGWRIPLEALIVILTFNEIRKEVEEFYQSRRENKRFVSWRKKEIMRDLEYCHPRWSQEKTCIKQRIQQVEGRQRTYFQDKWNYLDWVTYLMLIIVITLHVINVIVLKNKYNDVFIRILACTIILVWIRLLKFARPFPTQGPFVVILDNILRDTIRWGFVTAMFYIPYAVAFWMLFGGNSGHPVEGYDSVFHLAYTILQYPLADNYGFEQMEEVAPVMARVLCGTFLIIAAIVLMNLYIALLSNTFQRVYDNARATAAMQRAHLLQDLESGASDKTVRRYREHIRTMSCPEECDYLVIVSDEENQNGKQKEKIALVHTIVSDRLGGKKFGRVQKSEFDAVLEDISLLKQSQNEMKKLLERFSSLLKKHGNEQMIAITSVKEEVTSLKNTMEEKFRSLESAMDLRFETLETDAKLRSSVLEGNINTRFDQLEIEFKGVISRYGKYEQHMMARVEDLEAYVVNVEDDKNKEKNERAPSPSPEDESSSPSGENENAPSPGPEDESSSPSEGNEKAPSSGPEDELSSTGDVQIVEMNREDAEAVASPRSKVFQDGTEVSDFDKSVGDSTEKQRRRAIALSGQAARDEYIARLKESLMKSTEERDT